MLDWFSGYVGYDASRLPLGRVLHLDGQGGLVRETDRWETVQGSWKAGVQVGRGSPPDGMLEVGAERLGYHCDRRSVFRVSGNPVKLLQGHNVAGPSVALLGPVLQAMVRAFGEGFRPPDADVPELPAVHRSRVDVTTAVDLGSHDAVHEWIQAAAASTRSRHGRAMDSGSTVYWGKHSTRWSLKAYCKHCELGKHAISAQLPLDELLEWTRTHLRIELTLRRPELKHRGTLHESIIWEFFKRVEVPTMKASMIDLESLRWPVRAVFDSWRAGTDLRVTIPRRTLYRYRKEVLDALGVDVLLPYADQSKAGKRVLLGIEELQAREVKNVPAGIQRTLFGA